MTPIQAAQTQNWRCSSSQEIKKKRKAETPFSSYIYIITEIKGSTICAKRVNGGKTICRDASKVILLRTAKINQRRHLPDDQLFHPQHQHKQENPLKRQSQNQLHSLEIHLHRHWIRETQQLFKRQWNNKHRLNRPNQ